MSEYAILTKGMSRRFGDIRAVDDISLQVPRGIIFGFLGPNGAGKTTTLRLLLGLMELDAGSATVLGYDVATEAHAIRERAGVLLENDGLYLRLSAYDNLEFFGRIYHIDPDTRGQRIQELLVHLELWERRHDRVATFSKGMRQKLAVARALIHRPSLIFLDEPSSGLDAVAATALREDIRALARGEGTTVFLTTHNLAEAEKVCDLVGVIRDGKLIACDTPDRLRLGKRHVVVQISGTGFGKEALSAVRGLPTVRTVTQEENHLRVELLPGAETAPLVSTLVREGARVEEVRKDQGSLEEAFVALVQGSDEADSL
jgi:ABC-2 type transport system ATP-binding protein